MAKDKPSSDSSWRQKDLSAINNATKSKKKAVQDTSASKFDRKSWLGGVHAAGYRAEKNDNGK